jgi:beta-lactamase class A
VSRTLAAVLLLALAAAGCERRTPGEDPRDREPAAVVAEDRGAVDDAPSSATGAASEPDWIEPLARELERIDAATPGALGVWIKHLGDGGVLARDAERPWYLSSTVKVPVAIAVLQLVDEGRLRLDDERVLAEGDFVDGAGELIWQEPGARFRIATLIEKSLVDSDSTATDMLIREVGVEELNRRIARWVPGGGFGPLTTILQVRYDAYGELHPGVAALDNMDLVRLRNAEAGAPRLEALRTTLGVPREALTAASIDEAFERYYASGRNSATLAAFGTLLEKLVRGELLSEPGTARMLGHMQRITTGKRRIQAGLPAGTAFAQKTGTQLARACNMGIVHPDRDDAVLVAACVEKFDELAAAERALREVGAAIAAAGLLQPAPR